VPDWPDTRDELEMVAKRVIFARVTNQNLVIYPAVTSLDELPSCHLEAVSSLMFVLYPIAFKVCPNFSRQCAYMCVVTVNEQKKKSHFLDGNFAHVHVVPVLRELAASLYTKC
jgi:hypothetical protein